MPEEVVTAVETVAGQVRHRSGPEPLQVRQVESHGIHFVVAVSKNELSAHTQDPTFSVPEVDILLRTVLVPG